MTSRQHVRRILLRAPLMAALVGCPAPPAIFNELKGPDPAKRREALVKLRTYVRDQAKPEIRDTLVDVAAKDKDLVVRTTAIRSLGRYRGDVKVRDALLVFLTDADPAIRAESAATLSRWNGPLVTRALVERLTDDPQPRVQEMALAALGYADFRGHHKLIVRCLGHPTARVRVAALRLLYRYGTPAPAESLERLQADADADVRATAAMVAAAATRPATRPTQLPPSLASPSYPPATRPATQPTPRFTPAERRPPPRWQNPRL